MSNFPCLSFTLRNKYFSKAYIYSNTQYSTYRQVYSYLSIDLQVWMFPHVDVDHGHLWREELKLVGSLITRFMNSNILRKEGTFFSISVTIYYHLYLQQYIKCLEVDLIGSKATNVKQEKYIFLFSCLDRAFNSVPFCSESSPCHLSHHASF